MVVKSVEMLLLLRQVKFRLQVVVGVNVKAVSNICSPILDWRCGCKVDRDVAVVTAS